MTLSRWCSNILFKDSAPLKEEEEEEGLRPLQTDNGETTKTYSEKAEVLNNFLSVFTREDLTNMPELEPRYIREPLMGADIMVSEIKKKLSKMNCDKSPGPDLVHQKVLKMCADSLAVPLTKVFKKSLETGSCTYILERSQSDSDL